MYLRPWNPQATEAPPPPICTVLHVDSSLARVAVRRHEGWTLDITLEGQDVPYTWDRHEVHLEQPAMWWPADMGAHPLYEWTWTHLPSNTPTAMCWECERSNGSNRRTVGARPFSLKSTAFQFKPVVPTWSLQTFIQTQDATLWKTLVEHARNANMNMVRVWGGGVYPQTHSSNPAMNSGTVGLARLHVCLRHGARRQGFTENVMREAEEQVRRLTHHPSLALWCGNNEMERAWQSWGWQDMYDLHGPDSARLADAYHRVFTTSCPKSSLKNRMRLPPHLSHPGRTKRRRACLGGVVWAERFQLLQPPQRPLCQ